MEWYIIVNFVIVSIVSYYIGRLHANPEKHKDWRDGTVWEKNKINFPIAPIIADESDDAGDEL